MTRSATSHDLLAGDEQSIAAATTLVELQALAADYWSRVDRTSDESVADLYTDDGAMILGLLEKRGRGAIEAFFVERNASETAAGRRTRHISSNLIAKDRADGAVDVRSLVLVFAGVGDPPLASAPPTTIADFDDVCRRDERGRWRFESRRASVVFTGAGAAAFAR